MKIILKLTLVVVLAFTTFGCSKEEIMVEQDILTQKRIEENKIPITVLVKYAFSINEFEKAVEAKFPELDLIQVGNYTLDMGVAEYAARMEHDDLTDIMMTWPFNVGKEYFEERLIDLSSLPATNKYVTAMLDQNSIDGQLFYLPGPSQVRGLVYNKTLFEENGWNVPTDFDSFVELCHTIEESGIRSLQLGLKNSEVLDTAFVGFSYESSFSKPKNAQWIEEYNQGNGNFNDNFQEALETFQILIDEGILKASDFDVDYSKREEMIFTRKTAMTEDSILLARMGFAYNGNTDEFALMPFFNRNGDDWSRLYAVCHIGLNKHLLERDDKEKHDLVMKIVDYISTPEGQMALAEDTGAMFSSLNGMAPPDIPEIVDLVAGLSQGRYAIFPTLKNAQVALREGLAGMVRGEIDGDSVAEMVDEMNQNPVKAQEPIVLGTATHNFTLIETGNFITDTMREKANSDIALFLDNGKDGLYNGKGVSGKIYEGDITDIDLLRILPDMKLGEKGELLKVTMTGQDLLTTLEYSIPVNNNRDGWFYYFSGLLMEYDPTAAPGTRIGKITDEQGNEIDSKKLYTVAVMDETIPSDFIKSCEETGITINTLLSEKLKAENTVSPSGDGRFKVIRK